MLADYGNRSESIRSCRAVEFCTAEVVNLREDLRQRPWSVLYLNSEMHEQIQTGRFNRTKYQSAIQPLSQEIAELRDQLKRHSRSIQGISPDTHQLLFDGLYDSCVPSRSISGSLRASNLTQTDSPHGEHLGHGGLSANARVSDATLSSAHTSIAESEALACTQDAL